jgi:hypothetical protein
MLSPTEFSVGSIGDATTLTLVLSRGKYEYPILVTQAPGSLFAVFLDGQHRFTTFDCTNNGHWKGLLIPNVTLELDETSVVDSNKFDVPLGALVRKGAQLSVSAKQDGGFPTASMVPLIVGLTPSGDGMEASFSRWQIVLGESTAKRVLKVIDVAAKPTA